MVSYPQPDTETLSASFEEPQKLRPLVPLQPPPSATIPPSTTVPANKHDAIPGYTRTSHIVPAAFPRSLPTKSPLRIAAISGKKYDAKTLGRAVIDSKLAFEKPESQIKSRGMSRIAMWNCVDRYARVPFTSSNGKKDTPGITLLVLHPTGFPRQIWEPTLAHLAYLATSTSGPQIDEIWSFESVHHGDSGLINHDKLSDTFDWQDHIRDIINFLMYYLPDFPCAHGLPTALDRVSRPERAQRRKVVGIGHSFGGTTLGLACTTHPDLFQSLILVEPLILPTSFKRGPILDRLLRGALTKPSQWPSRRIAKELFQKHPPMNAWDPAVIDVFVEHGLVGCAPGSASPQIGADTPVRLKTHPFDEAIGYCEWLVPYEAWTEVANLEPRIPLHWIMSGDTSAYTGGDAMTQATVWRRPVNASNVRIPGAGHLIVHEAPKALAVEILRFLTSNLEKVDAKL